ncbi:MAG TPA: hypothetical protein VFL64_11045, partial [Rhizobacter sp.]|nr:hypothetical protein [Rhizobacter sp.]
DFAAAIAKLSVVAESETAYQVNELQALVSKAYMRASIAAWPVNRCSDGMKRANSRHEEAFANAQQVHNLMMEAVRSGNKDINLSMLRDEHSMYMKRMEEASAERQKYDDQHQSELERFHAVLLPLLKAIREPMITTMSRIRGDLGLTTATGKLKDQMERMGKEADAELATTMQAIETLRRA